MNILQAIRDENLFRPFLGDEIDSWEHWLTALRVVYGLPVSKSEKKVIRDCTGRKPKRLPDEGFDTALFITGRRSGKSRIAAIVGAFEAALAGHEKKLSKGEKGVVPIISPSRRQSKIVRDYCRAIFEMPLLSAEIVRETPEGFELRNGNRIEILVADWRTLRGYTVVAAIVDEACFLGYETESKVKSDTELIRAVQPALATVGGRLVCISSPYAKKGWCYRQWKKHFGNNDASTLVWNCPSRTMNPTLPQSVVDKALAEDMSSARAEYLGQFRDDVEIFLPREVIEALVVHGRKELMPGRDNQHFAFVDVSGGRGDDAALAIAHRDGRKAVIDCVKRYRPPFSPHEVVIRMADEIKRFGIKKVTGDNYAAEFTAAAFRDSGLFYEKAGKNKSALYLELLPRICSQELELVDDTALLDQLTNLERRTRSGGRDIVDHPVGGHDDLANAVAGVVDLTLTRKRVVGPLFSSKLERRFRCSM